MRIDLLTLAQAKLEGAVQILCRFAVFAFVILAQARLQRLLALAWLENILDARLELAHGLGFARRQYGRECNNYKHSNHHRNLCLIFTACPAFTSTRRTWLGKVELRISIVCEPVEISSFLSGGLMPRLRPSTSTSPHGVTASSIRPTGSAFFFSTGAGSSAA